MLTKLIQTQKTNAYKIYSNPKIKSLQNWFKPKRQKLTKLIQAQKKAYKIYSNPKRKKLTELIQTQKTKAYKIDSNPKNKSLQNWLKPKNKSLQN